MFSVQIDQFRYIKIQPKTILETMTVKVFEYLILITIDFYDFISFIFSLALSFDLEGLSNTQDSV